MDNFSRIKCLGCGMLLTVIAVAELFHPICHDCKRESTPHTPEYEKPIFYHNLFVSGITDSTGTTVAYPFWPVSS